VSPQTFHQYLGLPSVIMPFCQPAFLWWVELVCMYFQTVLRMRIEWKLAATLHQDTSQLVMYSLMERLFNSVTEKTKIRSVCTCFPHTEIPFTQWKCHTEAGYFIKQYFYQKFTCELVFIAKTFSCFCHLHLLGYPLSQYVRFHKLPVSFVRWTNVLILLKMVAGSFQNVLCVVII
jgi:hypothetical protein